MTTPIGHSLFAVSLYWLARLRQHGGVILLLVLVFAAMVPDIDYYPLLWGDLQLANYNHQGFTHSLVFVLLVSVGIALIGQWLGAGKATRLYPFVVLAAASHLMLDFLTFDGREPVGIPLLWPFSDARFNAPMSIFGGFAKSSFGAMLSAHNLGVIGREILILGIPTLVIWLVARRLLNRRSEALPR